MSSRNTPTHWPHTAAILVGGKSSRMGRPKHELMLPDGQKLIDAVEQTLALSCATVVTIGDHQPLMTCRSIQDRIAGAGPIGGIEALLASGIDTEFIVCPCDLPLISRAIIDVLTQTNDQSVTVLHVEGRADFEPLPMRITIDAMNHVQSRLETHQHGLRAMIESLPHKVMTIPRTLAPGLTNINTPDEYEKLLRD